MTRSSWTWGALLVSAACATGTPDAERSDSVADPGVLMAADRAFNAAVAEGGSEAWGSWFAEDGAMIRAGGVEVRGRAEVTSAVGALDDPAVTLTWEPLRAEISDGGDLGWTTGAYTSEVAAPDGTVRVSRGRYVSIWRLETDGSWKVVMDLGVPAEEPASGAGG